MKKSLNKVILFITHPIVIYYIRHPIVLLKNRIIIISLWFKKIINHDPNFDDKIYSDVPIDIVIPTANKDCDILAHVIDSIRENIKHPIGDILIISPKLKTIVNLCKTKKCRFIDENVVLPITKKDINYTVAGVDRSGWLFQQLLKWGSDKYVKNDHFLIADADTIFCRPQVFIIEGKTVLSVNSQLCHVPYFKAYEKLTGMKVEPLMNLTSHHSLLKKRITTELKKKIEKHCRVKWYKALIDNIDQKEGSSVSDYETYGQFAYSKYPNKFLLEHWFNLSLNRSQIGNLSKLINKFGPNYKTISFHSYNK